MHPHWAPHRQSHPPHHGRQNGRIEANDSHQLWPCRLEGPVVQPVVVRRGKQAPPSTRPAQRRDGPRVCLDHSADASGGFAKTRARRRQRTAKAADHEFVKKLELRLVYSEVGDRLGKGWRVFIQQSPLNNLFLHRQDGYTADGCRKTLQSFCSDRCPARGETRVGRRVLARLLP